MQQNFALATKTLPNVWNCFEFLGLQKKILSQITFFWEKILNSDSFSDFVPKAPSRLSKLCWACPEELQKTKCFSPKQLCFHFSQNSGKNLSVELHSACPMQLLWIFQKIVTLNLLFCLGGTKSGYWQISCGRVVKTAFDFCRGEFGWTIPSLEKDILLCSLSDFEWKFFGFGRKILGRVQIYTISFLLVEKISLTEFFSTSFSLVSLLDFERIFLDFSQKVSVGLSIQHSLCPEESLEHFFFRTTWIFPLVFDV